VNLTGYAVTGIDVVISFFAIAALIFVLLPFHEYAHAWTAYKLGDGTAKAYGRLTLNPLAHIDPMGAFCMLILPFGWAKPVPIDPRHASRKISQRTFVALTAAAGPLSNILLSLIFVAISKLVMLIGGAAFSGQVTLPYFAWAFHMIAYMSVFLALFNLIPIPPLDGSKILFYFLNNRQVVFMERNAHKFRLGLILLLFLPMFDFIFVGMARAANTIMRGLDYATFFIP